MAKALVQLKEGSLLDLFGHQYIMSGEPCVAEVTSLVESVIAKGEMKMLASLKDDASNEELAKAKSVKDFLAKYDANKPAEKKDGNGEAPKGNPEPSKKK